MTENNTKPIKLDEEILGYMIYLCQGAFKVSFQQAWNKVFSTLESIDKEDYNPNMIEGYILRELGKAIMYVLCEFDLQSWEEQ